MYTKYKGDPYWLYAKFGLCKECTTNIKGKRAFFYPKTKDIFCEKCGEKHYQDFVSIAEDEDLYNCFNSYY